MQTTGQKCGDGRSEVNGYRFVLDLVRHPRSRPVSFSRVAELIIICTTGDTISRTFLRGLKAVSTQPTVQDYLASELFRI